MVGDCGSIVLDLSEGLGGNSATITIVELRRTLYEYQHTCQFEPQTITSSIVHMEYYKRTIIIIHNDIADMIMALSQAYNYKVYGPILTKTRER